MIKIFTLLGLMLLATSSGCQKENCIDESKIIEDCICTMQYDPVCGCDEKTYGNACEANCAGVVEFTKGACK